MKRQFDLIENFIEVFSGEDRVYIYINGKYYHDQSSFPEYDTFKLCEDCQPFKFKHFILKAFHHDDPDWCGKPQTSIEMLKFVPRSLK